jgi:AcrR family transcriptional regulator
VAQKKPTTKKKAVKTTAKKAAKKVARRRAATAKPAKTTKPTKQAPTSSDKKARAMQILDAAEQLLGEQSYDAVSARDIAERAGVNKALVFYYWGSKEQLFERVLQRYYERHRGALAAAFNEDGGELPERVHRVLDAYLDFIEGNRLYARLVQQQVSGGGPHLELVQRHLAEFFAWTTGVLAELAPATGPLAARHLYISISGIVINYFTYAPALGPVWGREPLSRAALAERREHVHWLVDCLLQGLDATRKQSRSNKTTQRKGRSRR